MKIDTERKIMNVREEISSVLFPRVCPSCGRLIGNVIIPKTLNVMESCNPYICRDCMAELDFAEGRSRCMCCSKPLDGDGEELCSDCAENEREFAWGRALMMHTQSARKIVYGLKYHSMKDNADFLGFEIAKRLGNIIIMMNADIMIPVPLHKRRELERDYNQAELIAQRIKFFMDISGLPCPNIDADYLKRVKNTERLKEMSASGRLGALTGAFEINRKEAGYKSVILIDDIFTSGATLNECAKTLHKAGVNVIYFITASIGS